MNFFLRKQINNAKIYEESVFNNPQLPVLLKGLEEQRTHKFIIRTIEAICLKTRINNHGRLLFLAASALLINYAKWDRVTRTLQHPAMRSITTAVKKSNRRDSQLAGAFPFFGRRVRRGFAQDTPTKNNYAWAKSQKPAGTHKIFPATRCKYIKNAV